MNAQPQKEHEWLQQLVGEWTFEHAPCDGQEGPPSTGSDSVRSIGGLWVLCEGKFEMPGHGTATTIMTLGYDPDKKKFVGTFIGSMMTFLWTYEGELDASGKVLKLDAVGPNFMVPGTTAKYQDSIEIKGPNERKLTSHSLGDDGKWVEFMKATYRRK